MEEYTIRKATIEEASFIADVIMTAEKATSDKLSLSTLFELPVAKVKELVISMLEEEIDGCEFSLSSYLITEQNGQPVAAVCGWLEGYHEGESSNIIKSNLLTFTFPKESLKSLISKSELISGILIEREKMALQFEYAHVLPGHRGNRLIEIMQDKMEADTLLLHPGLNKIQIQCFENSIYAIRMIERIGFRFVKKVVVDNDEILRYLPDKTKFLMEKKIN
jgi:hypothetical protein